jgi:hypothetical protein
VLAAVTPDRDVEMTRQAVDHGHPHPVQPAGEAIVALGELTPGVQCRQDDLDTRFFQLGVRIDRHAAPVVDDLKRAVRVQRDGDAARMAGERFIDRVVDDLLGQMIGPGRVGVHAGALANGLEPR